MKHEYIETHLKKHEYIEGEQATENLNRVVTAVFQSKKTVARAAKDLPNKPVKKSGKAKP